MISNKFREHLANGTVIKAVIRKLRYWTHTLPGDGNTYYGSEAEEYETKRVHTPEWQSQQQIAELIIDQSPDGSRVLDVPFGTGRFTDVYVAKGMSVAGLDISNEMIAMARQLRGSVLDAFDLRVGDARFLPWPDDTFDLVVCFRFLNHIISFGDAQVVLSELSRVCKGTVLVDIAFRNDSSDESARMPLGKEQAGMRLTENQVYAVLQDAGLKVDTITLEYKEGDGGFYAISCTSVNS